MNRFGGAQNKIHRVPFDFQTIHLHGITEELIADISILKDRFLCCALVPVLSNSNQESWPRNISTEPQSPLVLGRQVSSECQGEMLDYRRMLMEDFSLSPEIILSCRGEIEHHCSGLHRKGRTLHCLMKVVRGEKGNVGPNCQQAVRLSSASAILSCWVGRALAGSDLSADVLRGHRDCAAGSPALPGTTECWRQLCNCRGMKYHLLSHSTLVMLSYFFAPQKIHFELRCSGFCI